MEEHLNLAQCTGFDLTQYEPESISGLNPLVRDVMPLIEPLQSLVLAPSPAQTTAVLTTLLQSELNQLASKLTDNGYTKETIQITKQIVLIVIDNFFHRYNWLKFIPKYHEQMKEQRQTLKITKKTNLYTLANQVYQQKNISTQCLVLIYWCIKQDWHHKSMYPRKQQQVKEQVLTDQLFNLLWHTQTTFKKNLFLSPLPEPQHNRPTPLSWKLYTGLASLLFGCLLGCSILINTSLMLVTDSDNVMHQSLD